MPLDSVSILKGPISGEVPVFRFPRLGLQEGLRHAVFTRRGGVSRPPYHSLNASEATGDTQEAVGTNLDLIREAMDADCVIFMKQVHGRKISILRKNDIPETLPIGRGI